jgi:1-deoxy-D-xylulose-5-phosphate synthase
VSPFDLDTGKKSGVNQAPSYTSVFGKTLCDMAGSDTSIVAITAAMKLGTGLDEFAQLYPRRFFDVGIAEQHAVTLAAGLALGGFRPVVAIYSTFLQRAFDQLVQEICLQKLPVVFALDRAGLVGEDGPTHHGVFDLSYLRMLPNMTIMAPRDQAELRDMLWAVRDIEGPVAIRYPRGSGRLQEVDEEPLYVELGRSETVREGGEVCMLAVGRMVDVAVEAADILSKNGIEAEVINVRFVKPMDEEVIKERAKSSKILITLEENVLKGGFGEGVAALLEEIDAPCSLIRIGLPDHFVQHGGIAALFQIEEMDAESVAEAIMREVSE